MGVELDALEEVLEEPGHQHLLVCQGQAGGGGRHGPGGKHKVWSVGKVYRECEEISVDARRLPEVSGLLEAAEEEAGEDCLGVQVVRLPPLPECQRGRLVDFINSIDISS